MMGTAVKKELSVIVAIYNVEPHLEECLKSIADQKKENMEVWLMDDGSSDRSPAICDEFVRKDSRFHVIHQENQGVSVARNQGLAHAEGEWILFVDGDDLLEPGFTERLRFDQYGDSDIVFYCYTDMTPNGARFPSRVQQPSGPLAESVSRRLGYLLLGSSLKTHMKEFPDGIILTTPWGKMYRREFLIRNELSFFPGLKRSQDLLFNLQAYLKYPRCYLENTRGYIYRKNPVSVSNRYNPRITESYELLIRQCGKVVSANESRELRDEYYSLVVESFLYCCQIDFCNKQNPLHRRERKALFLKWRGMDLFEEAFARYHRSAFPKLGRRGQAAAFFCEKRLFGLYSLNYRFYLSVERLRSLVKQKKS